MMFFGRKKEISEERRIAEEIKKKEQKRGKELEKIYAKDAARAHSQNQVRGLLNRCENTFRDIIDREIRNAKYAQAHGIDFELNRAHVSDAMSGLASVVKARWYLNSSMAEDGLQGALISLNQALKTLERLNFVAPAVNAKSLRNSIEKINAEEGVTIDEAMVLEPTNEYTYKLDNGLFEKMMDGMSYEEALKQARQDPGASRYGKEGLGVDYSEIFKEDQPNGASGAEKILKERASRSE